jgi:type IV pilus assembly protein PilE
MNSFRRFNQGFTLIELMITVAIVGILAAIAYPSYTSQIEKGRRAECRGGLLKTMQQQERYYTQRNAYTNFTSGSTTSTVASFSGESLTQSACRIAAGACGAQALTECIELEATPTYADSKVDKLYFTSSGQKECILKGGSTKVSNTSVCWP